MVDIKKKNRIIQAYYMKIEPGALISEESEINKVCNCLSEEIDQSWSVCLGPAQSKLRDNGQSVRQQGHGLRHDAGAQSGDQQEAAGRAGGHLAEEHHLEGEHQHARSGDQQNNFW